MTDRIIAIERALTNAERTAILARITALNPNYHGLEVRSVLVILLDMDAHQDVIQPMYEKHAAGLKNPRLLAPAVLAIHYAYGKATDDAVLELMGRVESVQGSPRA